MIEKYVIKDFIQKIDLSPYKGRFPCYVSAVEKVFDYFNLGISDMEICFLTSGINIIYNKANKVFGYDFETSDLCYFGKSTERIVINNKSIIKKRDIEKLLLPQEEGQPSICFIMSDCLLYHRVFKEAGKREAHAVILYGYDLKKNKAIIFDPHIKVGYEKYEVFFGEIELEDFFRGLICCWKITPEIDIRKNAIYQNISIQLKRFLTKCSNCNIYNGSDALYQYFEEKLYEAKTVLAEQLWDFSKAINFDTVINGPCYIGAAIDQLESILLMKNEESLYNDWYRLSNQIIRAGYLKNREKLIDAIEKSNLLIDKTKSKIKNLNIILEGMVYDVN